MIINFSIDIPDEDILRMADEITSTNDELKEKREQDAQYRIRHQILNLTQTTRITPEILSRIRGKQV